MKRSFRVGAVFTGSAACAVGLAGTAHAAPDTANYFAGNCTGGTQTDLHLYYGSTHPTPACLSPSYIGETLYLWPSGKRFISYCGGKYSGYIDFLDGRQGHFTHGSVNHNVYSPITGVEFSKINTTGGDTCSNLWS